MKMKLENLTIRELKEHKKQQYVEANSSFIFRDLSQVAQYLGTRLNAKYGPKYKWESEYGLVSIYDDQYGGYLTVHYKGKQVASTHQCSRLFVNGAWVETVKPLFQEANNKKRRLQAERKGDEQAKLMAELSCPA